MHDFAFINIVFYLPFYCPVSSRPYLLLQTFPVILCVSYPENFCLPTKPYRCIFCFSPRLFKTVWMRVGPSTDPCEPHVDILHDMVLRDMV